MADLDTCFLFLLPQYFLFSHTGSFKFDCWLTNNKKAQLTLSNPRDVKACKNCSNSTCFVSFYRIPFARISKFRPRPI